MHPNVCKNGTTAGTHADKLGCVFCLRFVILFVMHCILTYIQHVLAFNWTNNNAAHQPVASSLTCPTLALSYN